MSIQDEIKALMKKERYDFEDLATITRILRSEEGCPWDREQDHHSIRASMIEETYEVVEAIDTENATLLREELGDALFQVMFHAQIETEAGRFGVQEVVDDICKKMIHRHPHVFGSISVDSSAQVLQNWEMIKSEEKKRETLSDKLRAIPPMMPALMRAGKVGKKAGRAAGETREEILSSIEADLHALHQEDFDAHERIGALLLRVTDLARAMGVDAEHALSAATDRLIEQVTKEEESKKESN